VTQEAPLKTVRRQADLRGCVFKYVLLLGVAAYLFVLQPELAETEEDLGAIASQIAQRPVAVECQGIISHAIDVTNSEGRVEYTESGAPADKTELKRDVCKRLGGFRETRGAGRYACLVSELECTENILKTVKAIHTLSHEAWHLAGVKDERIAECYAMQTNQLARRQLARRRGWDEQSPSTTRPRSTRISPRSIGPLLARTAVRTISAGGHAPGPRPFQALTTTTRSGTELPRETDPVLAA